jgi:hypothetical protein
VIDLSKLPKEIRDTIELKEAVDQTFSRFCIDAEEPIFVNGLMSRMKNITEGDLVVGSDGSDRCVKKVWYSKKECLKICTDSSGSIIVSKKHIMVLNGDKLVSAGKLSIGDILAKWKHPLFNSKRINKFDYDAGVFAGVYLADGNSMRLLHENALSGYGASYTQITNRDKALLMWCGKYAKLTFGFSSYSIKRVKNKHHYKLMCYGRSAVDSVIDLYGAAVGRTKLSEFPKKVDFDLLNKKSFAKGFLDGFSSCDMCAGGKIAANVTYSIKSKEIFSCLMFVLNSFGFKPTTGMIHRLNDHYLLRIPAEYIGEFLFSLNLKTKHKILAVKKVLKSRFKQNASKRLRKTKMCIVDNRRLPIITSIEEVGMRDCVDIEIDRDKLFALANGIVTHNCDEEYSEILWNILAERADPGIEHSFIASIYGGQGKGKSMAALAMCCYLDPTFTVDQIFFDYNDLVYNRHKLKPNSAVLVDEQSQSFGLDSHRVMVILASLKEQLRKKSIHFFFCAPVLYEEYKSSMYLFETMFIDYETQECYAAMKTREGLTLGHVRIPYPLKMLEDGTTLASKELIAAYEAKKDAHLERLLNSKNIDVFEQRAEQVVQASMFRKAEQIYVRKMGYIPQSSLINIINKLYPEYSAGVVPVEIAGRIKLNKELSGQWEVSGYGSKKVAAARQDARRRK